MIDLRRGAQSLLFRKAYNGGYLEVKNSRTIEGERISSEWTFDQPIWFKLTTSRDIKKIHSSSESHLVIEFENSPEELQGGRFAERRAKT